MPRQYRPREAAKIAASLGWEYSHHTGSHAIYTRAGHSHITIPEHRREIRVGTMGSIIKQMGLTRREFDKIAEEVL